MVRADIEVEDMIEKNNCLKITHGKRKFVYLLYLVTLSNL